MTVVFNSLEILSFRICLEYCIGTFVAKDTGSGHSSATALLVAGGGAGSYYSDNGQVGLDSQSGDFPLAPSVLPFISNKQKWIACSQNF